jgi:hypothetical protein
MLFLKQRYKFIYTKTKKELLVPFWSKLLEVLEPSLYSHDLNFRLPFSFPAITLINKNHTFFTTRKYLGRSLSSESNRLHCI